MFCSTNMSENKLLDSRKVHSKQRCEEKGDAEHPWAGVLFSLGEFNIKIIQGFVKSNV